MSLPFCACFRLPLRNQATKKDISRGQVHVPTLPSITSKILVLAQPTRQGLSTSSSATNSCRPGLAAQGEEHREQHRPQSGRLFRCSIGRGPENNRLD